MAKSSKEVPARYRRIAQSFFNVGVPGFDFSEDALVQAFERETYGTQHDMSRNGFAFGKKSFDITVAAWKEDLASGLFCKDEFLRDFEEGSFEHEFLWNIIKDFRVAPLFGR